MYCGAEALIILGIRKSSVQPMIIAMMISAVNVMEITWFVSVHLSADADGFSFSVDAVNKPSVIIDPSSVDLTFFSINFLEITFCK